MKFLLLSLVMIIPFVSYSNANNVLKDLENEVGQLSTGDKAGEQTEHAGFSLSDNITGYLVYLPKDYYDNPTKKFPVVVFLHGVGERGSNLSMVRRLGPPKMVDQGKDFPFILISPQSKSSWVDGSINLLVDKIFQDYRADESRLYVTGLSMGGAGTWNYTCNYPERVAAAVPICGWGPVQIASNMKNVPVWATHNKGDNVVGVSGTINMVNALENAKASPWPIEIIYQVDGHDAWTATYNDQKMWDWMLSKSKSGTVSPPPTNKAPVANAGSDKSIQLPTNSLSLSGAGSDADGSISSYQWSKSSGGSATMTDANKSTLRLSNLLEGTYVFKLTATDNSGAKGTDEVKVVVLPAAVSKPPTTDNGLLYTYYEGEFTQLPNFSNLTSKATGYVSNFDLSPSKRSDYFALSFEGSIEVTQSGEYTFYTSSDDGSKLYINNKEIVNNDGIHGSQEKSGKITLSAGKHAIKVTYFENRFGETLAVKYAGPGVAKQTIPASRLFKPGSATPAPAPPSSTENGLLYSYFEGEFTQLPNFSNLTSKATGYVANFDLSPSKRSDYFALSFEGNIEISQSGEYTFYTSSDDGSKLYINNKEIVSNDGIHGSQEKSGKITLSAGKHAIKVTYFENRFGETLAVKYAGPGVAKQTIPASRLFKPGTATPAPTSPPSTENGLLYSYYEGEFTQLPNFSNLTKKATGYTANFDLSPRKRNDYFALSFEGSIEISQSGEYTFYAASDDGSKLYINNKEILNNDGIHGYVERYGKVTLAAGRHAIKVVYFENKFGETLAVKYAGPGVAKQTIPSSKLFRPSTNSLTAENNLELKSEIAINSSDKIFGETPAVNIYPNPVEDQVNIDLTTEEAQEALVSIIDLSGREILNSAHKLKSGQNEITLEIADQSISKGLFILQIQYANGKKSAHKLIKN